MIFYPSAYRTYHREGTPPHRPDNRLVCQYRWVFWWCSIAANPDGDSYRAGGGGRFFSGYIFYLNPLYLRTGFGLRYQGGVGENTGFLGQLQLSRQFRHANIGVGLLADSGGRVTSEFGQSTKLGSNITPELFLEIPAGRRLELGLSIFVNSRYSQLNSESTHKGPNIVCMLSLVNVKV